MVISSEDESLEESPSEAEQRHNNDFENGDITEEQIRKQEDGENRMPETLDVHVGERYLLGTIATRQDIKSFSEEEGSPRDHQPYREASELDLFVQLAGYDFQREQVDLPGNFELELDEDGTVDIEYSVSKKSDILGDDIASSFLEYFVGEGIAETHESGDTYEIEMNMGGENYLDISMSYEETSNRGRKKALEKIDMVNDLLVE